MLSTTPLWVNKPPSPSSGGCPILPRCGRLLSRPFLHAKISFVFSSEPCLYTTPRPRYIALHLASKPKRAKSRHEKRAQLPSSALSANCLPWKETHKCNLDSQTPHISLLSCDSERRDKRPKHKVALSHAHTQRERGRERDKKTHSLYTSECVCVY